MESLKPESTKKDGAEGSNSGKKAYTPPELFEWGRILDLTLGPGAQLQDGFGKGGTKVV